MKSAKEYGFKGDYDEYGDLEEEASSGQPQPKGKISYKEIKGKREVQ